LKKDIGPMDFLNRNSKHKDQGKLTGLKEVISQYVKPGITLHLAGSFGGPTAAICEIIRQFLGKNPELVLVQSTISGHALNLVSCDLVKKLICSACVDMSASSRPSQIIRKAINEKRIEIENWSLCSLQQRLMAGAFGFPFIPTRSVSGSDIASENRDYFKEIHDPFNSEEKTGIVKALNPDLSIIHAWAADPYGNTILSAPYGDDIWGSLASTNGAIVTAEEHLEHGGLGSRVAQVIAKHHTVPMEFVALKDTYAESGKPAELLQRYGLTAGDIEQAVRRVLARK